MHAEFIAYAGDCRVKGRIDVAPDARLSDWMNLLDAITVRDAELTSHADGHVVSLDEITIDRYDLYAVEALSARGDTTRRVHTVRHRLQVKLGPYMVLGYLHAFPGSGPLVSLPRRAPMIPLTTATIAFDGGTAIEAHDIETLIVNRELVDWVRPEEVAPALLGFKKPAPEPAAG